MESGGVINVQVLNEFVNVCRRKLDLSWADARASLTVIRTVFVAGGADRKRLRQRYYKRGEV